MDDSIQPLYNNLDNPGRLANKSTVHPLKEKGDLTDTNKYRGIALLPCAFKVLTKLINNLKDA